MNDSILSTDTACRLFMNIVSFPDVPVLCSSGCVTIIHANFGQNESVRFVSDCDCEFLNQENF